MSRRRYRRYDPESVATGEPAEESIDAAASEPAPPVVTRDPEREARAEYERLADACRRAGPSGPDFAEMMKQKLAAFVSWKALSDRKS